MDLAKFKSEIIFDEGYAKKIYRDTLGNKTVGVGHLILKTDPEYDLPVGFEVSEERIEMLLEQDLKNAIDTCILIFDNFYSLPEEAQLVLANMSFQLGYNRLTGFKKMIAAVKEGDFKMAAYEIKDSLLYRQTPKDAQRLADRMEKIV